MITLKQLKDKLHKDFGWETLESDDNKWFLDNLLKDTIQAIDVIRCCTELKALDNGNFEDWLVVNGYVVFDDYYLKNDIAFSESDLIEIYNNR